MTLFDIFEQKHEFELYDAKNYRVILRDVRSQEDAEASNDHFKRSLCPHLFFRRAESRRYKIKT